MSYLGYLCLLAYSGVQHILCCVFVFLRLGYTMLSVSLDCPYLIAPSSWIHYVASFSGLSIFDCPFVLDTLCCQFLWIVHAPSVFSNVYLSIEDFGITSQMTVCRNHEEGRFGSIELA
jgi:hypothetical protein